MWEVDVSLIEGWLLGLTQDDYDLIIAALEILADEGPTLGRPLVDTVKASRHKNMKELRPGSIGRSEIRNPVRVRPDPSCHPCSLLATRNGKGNAGTPATSLWRTTSSMTTQRCWEGGNDDHPEEDH